MPSVEGYKTDLLFIPQHLDVGQPMRWAIYGRGQLLRTPLVRGATRARLRNSSKVCMVDVLNLGLRLALGPGRHHGPRS